MRTCERLVKEGRFVPTNPVGILTTSYCELLQNKVPLLGKGNARPLPCFLPPLLVCVLGHYSEITRKAVQLLPHPEEASWA